MRSLEFIGVHDFIERYRAIIPLAPTMRAFLQVIGDTWDAWPQLKLLALKRLHKYTVSYRYSELAVSRFAQAGEVWLQP